MRDSAYDPPALTPQFWARHDVRRALERQDIGALFRLLSKHGISQTRIATAVGMGQNRVSLISRDKQAVTTLTLLARIAAGLSMPDHARTPWESRPGGQPGPASCPRERRATRQPSCCARSPPPGTWTHPSSEFSRGKQTPSACWTAG